MSVYDDGTDESLFGFYMNYLKAKLDQHNPQITTNEVMHYEIDTNTPVKQGYDINIDHTIPQNEKRKMSINITRPLKVI